MSFGMPIISPVSKFVDEPMINEGSGFSIAGAVDAVASSTVIDRALG